MSDSTITQILLKKKIQIIKFYGNKNKYYDFFLFKLSNPKNFQFMCEEIQDNYT